MSDMKKWMKLIESVEARIVDSPENAIKFKKNATVTVSPNVGGGVGRFVAYSGDESRAMIDIKGVMRELSAEDFSSPERDYEDPYVKGNDWFHVSQEPDSVGTLNDRPEFRAGDMVKIADVYGAVIGPGYGIFIAYSTSGQECIISFDNKEIVVPTANVAAVLEQNAKDEFATTDNDGNLSPMSRGSENVKIEVPGMDQKDEFSKWMSAVEEALESEGKDELEEHISSEECACGQWDCPICFPEQDVHPGETGRQAEPESGIIIIAAEPESEMGDACPNCGFQHGEHEEHGYEEVPMHNGCEDTRPVGESGFNRLSPGKTAAQHNELARLANKAYIEATRQGNGTMAAHYAKQIEFHKDNANRLSGTKDTDYQNANETAFADRYSPEWTKDEDGQESPLTYGECNLGEDGEFLNLTPEMQNMASKILYMQDMGLSNDEEMYTPDQLMTYTPEEMKACYSRVIGGVSEDFGQQEEEMLAPPQQQQGGAAMGPSAGGGASGGAKYAPGTAPTMPESIQRGQLAMKNVDKDVAAMLQSLKKYDKLTESVAPVLMSRLAEKKGGKPEWLEKKEKEAEKKEGKSPDSEDLEEAEDRNPWMDLAKKDDKKSGTTKTATGLKHEKAEDAKDDKKADKEDIEEGADPDVLAWMGRFAKLGNMKGYGR